MQIKLLVADNHSQKPFENVIEFLPGVTHELGLVCGGNIDKHRFHLLVLKIGGKRRERIPGVPFDAFALIFVNCRGVLFRGLFPREDKGRLDIDDRREFVNKPYRRFVLAVFKRDIFVFGHAEFFRHFRRGNIGKRPEFIQPVFDFF